MAAVPASRRRVVYRAERQSSLLAVGLGTNLAHENPMEDDHFARRCDSRSCRTARLVAI